MRFESERWTYAEAASVALKKRNANDGGGLEYQTDAAARIALFDTAHHVTRHARARRVLEAESLHLVHNGWDCIEAVAHFPSVISGLFGSNPFGFTGNGTHLPV